MPLATPECSQWRLTDFPRKCAIWPFRGGLASLYWWSEMRRFGRRGSVIRVLVAFEDQYRAYREAISAVIGVLRPQVEVTNTGLEDLEGVLADLADAAPGERDRLALQIAWLGHWNTLVAQLYSLPPVDFEEV